MSEYARQGEITSGCKYPSTVAVEDGLNINSQLWSLLDDDVHLRSPVPYCVKRQLVDLHHVRNRCKEEIGHIKEEMARVFCHFERKLKLLEAWSKELIISKDSEASRGLLCIARTKFDELSVFTRHLHGLFLGGSGDPNVSELQADFGILPDVDSDDDEDVESDEDNNTDGDMAQQLGQTEVFEDLRSILYAEYGSDDEPDSENSDLEPEIP